MYFGFSWILSVDSCILFADSSILSSADTAILSVDPWISWPEFFILSIELCASIVEMSVYPCILRLELCKFFVDCILSADPCILSADPCILSADPCILSADPCILGGDTGSLRVTVTE